MDEERRRKIEAGKSKWAEFKRKKNRSLKSNSHPDRIFSNIQEKSCPADPGGIENRRLGSAAVEKTNIDNSSDSENQYNPVHKTISIKCMADENENSTCKVTSVTGCQDEHSSEEQVSVDGPRPAPNRSTTGSSFSVESFLSEGTIEDSEASSGSDNSTITGNSDTPKSDSTAENSSSENSPCHVVDSHQLESCSHLIDENDSRPDDEKFLENSLAEEKEIHVSTMEDCFELREDNVKKLSLHSIVKMESSHFALVEDDPVPLLNADDTELVSLYEKKIKKFQEAIQQRDSIISQLSKRLESAMDASNVANTAGNSQVELLKEEINLLHMKMKETTELVNRQKTKNGNLEIENSVHQTEAMELINKSEAGIQVETNIISLLQSCDLKNISINELLGENGPANSEFFHEMVLKLCEFLTSQFSHVHIEELMMLLRNDTCLQECCDVPERTENIPKKNLQNDEQVDTATVLKKITSLNMVAKLIESLISISSGDANDAFSDFSPSKFQSFFLKRLHSVETGDILPDASENESVVSDYNYAEVETPCTKPSFESSLSIEQLRRRNISEDFSLVTEFLQDEMLRICSFIPSMNIGPQGDGLESQEIFDEKESASVVFETGIESDYKKILHHKFKLEARLKNLKLLDKELHDIQSVPHQISVDSDTMIMSEDNLMMEELPLSCISLLSLTDSEYKTENIATDSETNMSRKVSMDMTRSLQERDFCIRCERNFDLLKERYENEMLNQKASLESSCNAQKNEFLESIKALESDIDWLKKEKENLNKELNEQIELLCSENKMKIVNLLEQHNKELCELEISQNKYQVENEELDNKVRELEEKLTHSNRKIMEKAEIEITLQNQIADLIQEHEQDVEALRLESEAKLDLEKKQLKNNYQSSFDVLKKVHEDEIDDIKCQIKKEYEAREQNLLNEHSKTINMIEAAHCDESAIFQKKIEQLLEEKCELLSKTTHEYETILKKNHRVLVILCKQLLSKINAEKERVINESLKSVSCNFDTSFSDIFDQLNKSLENGLVRFLNQNYFMNSNEEFCLDETEYLPIELNYPTSDEDLPLKIEMKKLNDTEKKNTEMRKAQSYHGSLVAEGTAPSESSLDSEDLNMIHSEINKLQEEFQKDVAVYKDVNNQLHQEIQVLKKQVQELEDQKENLEIQLQEKEKELVSKDSLLTAMDTAAVKGGIQLSATDIRSWQVQAAQTNSRLLHVLSDLVKTFLDIENDINSHLLEYGLIPPRSGTLNHHDDDTGQSVGSREDFNSLSLGECPNLDLSEDGPDLTPRAWDVFITAANYDTDLEGEDVVLGASRRLRMAVDHVLNLLSRALENHQNQDLKLLLKRNEELSNELQEESQGRDAVHMELVTAESTVRKLESEKQRLEDLNRDLKDEFDMLKRELSIERSKMSHIEQEKESAYDEIHILKEQCELMASRLGDPEKTENSKMLNSSGTCMHENSELLQENSRLSSEKQTVQKNLSKERQSFLDRLHQMEIALEELNAEKDDLVEKKCKEIRDLKAEMEAMEKQLQSNRKFIEQQAQEREQEREEFIKEINKMQDFVREKEKIQSTEAQLTKEIESLEQLLRARIDDHKHAMTKKDEVEKELRQSLDKIRDLREVIEELEKQLDLKSRIEAELRQKLSHISESIPSEIKNNNSDTDSAKNVHVNGEANEQLHNLKEQLASRSQEIESMSQSQTLLHELRGQIHFLEAKVEQRARLLETSILSSASSPVQSGATSPSGSQDSESLQIPCEDGWEMSPRSIHWLEVRRLEEKIGRLVHIDEELLKKNKEYEQQLKRMKSTYSECEHENAALQEKLSEQLMQISALKSHIDEQKHRCLTPQKTHSLATKIEELQEELEKKTECNKRLLSDLQDAQTTVNVLQEEIYQKNEMVAVLQKCAENVTKPDTSELDSSYDFSSIEEIQNQLAEKIELMKVTKKENDDLQADIEYLKTENSSLKSLLKKSEDDVDAERAQVETLYKEMANLAENSKEGAMPLNKTNSNDTNEQKEEKQGCNTKLSSWESRLKAKNLEILMLKATVTKLETTMRVRERELELEQVQVETLLQELGSLTGYQKRLEQDFNTVQDMMQQKERELATLHEETEAQLKLEAEIESMEKELKDQREVEAHLRKKNQQLEAQLELYKNLINENERKDLYVKNLEEKHKEEIQTLHKQVEFLKNFNTENQFTDIEELIEKIMEATETFKINEVDGDTFQKILSDLLRNTIDHIVEQLKKQHNEHVNAVEKKWQDKINEELSSRNSIFNSENEKLQKKHCSEINKLVNEKDAFWQEKVNSIELQLKNEKVKCEQLHNSTKGLKEELLGMYTNEINTLRQNAECALKEKVSLENVVKDLKKEMQQLKLAENNQSSKLSKEYDNKLSAISKTIKETFEKEKEKMIASHQEKISRLQKELDLRLEQEKDIKVKHMEELAATQKYFENCWATEMKKIKDFQSEDHKKVKNNSEKVLKERLKKAKEEFALHVAEEREEYLLKHKHELEQLQKKHEKEKKFILEMKDKAIKEATDVLEKKFNSNLAEIQGKLCSQSREQRKWEEENLQLVSSHRKQMSALKQELKNRYEKQLQAQAAAHSTEIQRLHESYNMQVEEVHHMINEAKQAASKSGCPDCGTNRTTTPSSDMTSSDEACSSCQEDMLAVNKHILVDKIHQDGKRVLSLVESSTQPLAAVKEAHLWLEERRWIINKLKTVIPATSNENLKMIISNLVDEVQKFRVNFETALEENSDLKQKLDELEHQLTIQYSKLYDAQLQLKKQKETNEDLELLLSSKTAELSELRRRLTETNRFSHLTADKETFTPNSGSSGSSYEIGCLRSADEPRSAEKFSMYVPDIENTPSMEKTPKNKVMHSEEVTIPKTIASPLISPPEESNVLDGMSKVKEKLLAVLNKGADATDAKLHGLYWVYRRSQSYNKALIYQKRYLLMLLKGFLLTENATLVCLNQMNIGKPSTPLSEVTVTDSSLHGRSRFRSAVFVVIALQRMKFCVRRWRLLARIPSTHVINVEIQSVFQNYSFLSPTISPGGYHLSSHSLASASLFIGGRDYKSSQVSTSSRSENKFKNSANPDRSQLIEYVHRLETLQKQLGLDNCR